MASVYLYIGAEKTGTTFLQYSFLENNLLLKSYGLFSPFFLFKTANQMELAGAFLDDCYCKDVRLPESRSDFKKSLKEYLETNSSKDIYFISEHLSSRFGTTEEVECLTQFLSESGHEVVVVVCVREPKAWLSSSYGEYVKCGGIASLSGIFEGEEKDAGKLRGFNYLDTLSVWFQSRYIRKVRVLDYQDVKKRGLLKSALLSFDRKYDDQAHFKGISKKYTNNSISYFWYVFQRFIINRVTFLKAWFVPRRQKIYNKFPLGAPLIFDVEDLVSDTHIEHQQSLYKEYISNYKFFLEGGN